MQIGDVIASIRKEKGISQKQMTEDLDITITYLSLIENGKKTPSIMLMKSIADYFKISFSDLLLGALKGKPKAKADQNTFNDVKIILNELATFLTSDTSKAKKRTKKQTGTKRKAIKKK